MNQKEFLDHLRYRTPNSDSYNVEPRSYKNAKGIDELVFLTRNYWDYADWLEETVDEVSIAEWVVHCDKNPCEGYTLSHQLMYWLWFDECNRFRAGDPTPNPYPPMGYEGWADEFHGS